MKKIIAVLIVLVMFPFVTNAAPENVGEKKYKEYNGNYSIKNAYCEYYYPTSNSEYFKVQITIKDNNMSSSMNYSSGFNSFVAQAKKTQIHDLEIDDMFIKNQTTNIGEFKCLDKIYLYKDFHGYLGDSDTFQILKSNSIDQYKELSNVDKSELNEFLLDSSKTTFEYEESHDEVEEDIKYSIIYQMKKHDPGYASRSKIYDRAPDKINYVKYENGKYGFLAGTEEWKIDRKPFCEQQEMFDNMILNMDIEAKKAYVIEECYSEEEGKYLDTCMVYDISNIVNLDPEDCERITPEEQSGPSELPEIKHCNSLLGNPKCNGKSEDPECLNKNATPAYYMSIVFRLMRWAAIILLIVMSILEFTGATASGDEDQLQKVIKRTGIRLGLCVLIFLLPYLIDYLLSLLDQAGISDCVNIN